MDNEGKDKKIRIEKCIKEIKRHYRAENKWKKGSKISLIKNLKSEITRFYKENKIDSNDLLERYGEINFFLKYSNNITFTLMWGIIVSFVTTVTTSLASYNFFSNMKKNLPIYEYILFALVLMVAIFVAVILPCILVCFACFFASYSLFSNITEQDLLNFEKELIHEKLEKEYEYNINSNV